MRKRRFVVLIPVFALSLFIANIALAQEAGTEEAGTISGTIVDSTSGDPLPGVNVRVLGTQKGGATGAQGRFEAC
jgi:hypothetical protein